MVKAATGFPLRSHNPQTFSWYGMVQSMPRLVPLSATTASLALRRPKAPRSRYLLLKILTDFTGCGRRGEIIKHESSNNVLAADLDGIEPNLTRHGYSTRALAELLNVRPAEIRAFLHGQLAAGHTQELHAQLLAAGLPV